MENIINDLLEENKRLRSELKEAKKWISFPSNSPIPLFRVNKNIEIELINDAGKKALVGLKRFLNIEPLEYFTQLIKDYDIETGFKNFNLEFNKEHFQVQVYFNKADNLYDIFFRNNTERHNALIDLEIALSRLSSLIANLNFGILVENENREIVLTNKYFCDAFGIPLNPDLLIGADCTQAAEQSKHLFKDPEKFVADINLILKDRKEVLDNILETVDGKFYKRDYIPIFTNNEYKGHLWRYSDVTERTVSIIALQESEEKFRTLIENMNLGMLEVDNDDHILYVNQSFQNMTGYSAADLLGKEAGKLLMDKDEQQVILEKNDIRKTGIMDVYEVKTKRKDGDIAWMLISFAPILNSKKETVGSIGIHLDITDRKILEEELKDAKKIAEESSKAKELFMATMSHEIRTPMNAIIGMQRLLAKTIIDNRQRRYVDAIGISASNLLTLLNDVLDFTKIQSSKLELSNAPFELRETIRNTRNMLEFKADEKGIRFDAEVDPSIPEYVTGDNNRLYQILINLAGNAIKFTDKGSVTLSVESVSDNKIKFCVKDTGVGMNQTTVEKIFDAFTQADASIYGKFGGTGLGLSISKELVEIMGGTISVVSEISKGSIFSFELDLPACDGSEIKLNKTTRTEARLDGSLILVVEDNDFNRLLAQTVLESVGASVSLAVNGKDAITSVVEHKPNLILMDLQMPVMNGIDATNQIRKLGYEGAILALTANVFPEEREKCLNIGMDDLVIKPFDEIDLVNKVAEWLIAKPIEKESTLLPEVTIDLTRLKKTSMNNTDFYLKMLGLAQSQISQAIQEMKIFIKAENYLDLAESAHRIKPTLDHLEAIPCKYTIRKIESLKTNTTDRVNAESYLATFCEEVIVLNKLLLKAQNPG